MKLFGVTKTDKHWIFTILGVRISIRSKYLELNARVRNLEKSFEKLDVLCPQKGDMLRTTSSLVAGETDFETAVAEVSFSLWNKLFGVDCDVSMDDAKNRRCWVLPHIAQVLNVYNTSDAPTQSNRVITYFTQETAWTGLADRLKTISTAYVMAAESGLDFYLYHDTGFDFTDYLLPNEIDWRIDKGSICFNLNHVSPLFFIKKFRSLERREKDYHIYQSDCLVNDLLRNTPLKDKYTDGAVFRKLFKFSPKVIEQARNILSSLGVGEKGYVAFHCRFLNFFEKVEKHGVITSTPAEREEMINAVHRTLKKIHQRNNLPIILFSDSNSFAALKHPDYVHVIPGKAAHVVSGGADAEATMRIFVDLYIMSNAQKVYSLVDKNVYHSGFSRLGAAIGDVLFIRTSFL